ncbi:MAG: amidase family protein [Pseudomonadota bacterium]|nr:amidase family protein [Pseudomonadota bacterium]
MKCAESYGPVSEFPRAIAEAERIGQPARLAATDPGGVPLAYARMDGAKAPSWISTRNKAAPSALSAAPTGGAHAGAELQAALAHESRWTDLIGGLPIMVDGLAPGAVAAGSGTGTQVFAVARAGAAAIPGADLFEAFRPMGRRGHRHHPRPAGPGAGRMSLPPPLPPPLPGAAPLAALIRSRAPSAREAAAALARTEALEGGLRAFCTLASEAAPAAAGAVDAALAPGQDPGPLAGAPVAVKGLIVTEGPRTPFGSPLCAGFVAEEDGVCVRRLRAAGAVAIGRTDASEVGCGPAGRNPLLPATRNPRGPALTPGGASAGSAMAVATGAAADTEAAAPCEVAARDLAAALGASLTPAASDTGPVQPVFEAIVAMETDRAGLSAMARAAGRRCAGPLATVLEANWTADAFTAALIGRKRIGTAAARFMDGFGLLLRPAAGAPAFPVGRQGPERIGGRRPAAGPPVGLRIIGRRLDDLAVLRAAAAPSPTEAPRK